MFPALCGRPIIPARRKGTEWRTRRIECDTCTALLRFLFVAPLNPEKQREFAVDVVRRLREHGYTAYWAGGCVRDLLLDRTPKDYDVATDATPDEIRRVFGRRRTVAVGAAFGVITVLGPPGAGQVEVATFRSDATYSDGRHPDAVMFSSPEEDAARRDFTINGMFYDPIERRVIDFVGGQRDLKNHVLRAIGQPVKRFAEDKLRLLRAVRFAAAYDLVIEPETYRAIVEMADEITVVSAERIAQEMRWMLTHASRARAMQLVRETRLLSALFPELMSLADLPHENPAVKHDLWQHTLRVMELLNEPSFSLALAALLHDVGKPSTVRKRADGHIDYPGHEAAGEPIAKAICQRWRLSNKETSRVGWLVRHHDVPARALQMPWHELQPLLIDEGAEELLQLAEADLQAQQASLEGVEYCRRMLAQPPDVLNPAPLLNGHDLLAHGIPRGKQIRHLLEQVRIAQLEKRIATKQQALALVDRLLAHHARDSDSTPPNDP